jgi:hypothetical protein
MKDMSPLIDSLEQVRYGRRIDYIVAGNEKQVRLRGEPGNNQYFTLNNGVTMSLKMEEDTLTVTGVIAAQPENRYYRLSFFLNDMGNLNAYNNGQLQQKIEGFIQGTDLKCLRSKDGHFYLKDNPGITAPAPAGKMGGTGLLILRPSVDIQNYRARFVPSVTVGLAIINRRNSIYQEYGLSSESHFGFTNEDGRDKIRVQSFLTLSYGRGKIASNLNFPAKLFPYFSLGYLLNREGSLYEKNTFRLGVGRFFLGNISTKIEPAFYMNGLFKNFTPSLRVVQMF